MPATLVNPISRPTPRLCVALLCVLVSALGIGAGLAEAANEFGSYGDTAGEFIEPNGIAVDRERGNVFIVDTNDERVEKFTRAGTFLLAWGWGVADGRTRALQRCTAATRCFAGLRGTGGGQLGFAEGVAVDSDPRSPSHHDVYVVDISGHRVEKFTPTGRLLLVFGRAVNETAHKRHDAAEENVCPIRRGDQCQAGTAGSGNGQFEFAVEGNFIAVGSMGTVYVGDRNRVQELSPAGVYQSQVALGPRPQVSGPEAGGTIALAVDSSGDLYVVRNGVSGVRKYTAHGVLEQTLNAEGEPEYNEGPTPAIALDSAGHLFVDYHVNEQHRLGEYDSSGAELAGFDAGMEDGLHGIAFGDAIGKLYVVNTNNNVTPVVARVRLITPPRLTSPVLSGFGFLAWVQGQ